MSRRRARVAWQRRSPLVATLVVALGGGIPLSIAALETNGVDVPGLSAPPSLMAMLDKRSPGERTTAELTKSKRKLAQARQRALGKIAKPEDRALPKAFVDAISPPAPTIPPVVPTVAVAAAEAPVAVPPLKAGLVPFGLSPPSGGGVFAAPGGGGGGGGGGGDNPPAPPGTPDTPPVVPPAIPEPGTWAMMLLGFGMTGWFMRRQRGRPARAYA